MQTLTPKQNTVLKFVKKYSTKHKFAPSLKEIGEHLKVSSLATIHQHLELLKQKGFLQRQKNQPRSAIASHTERMVQIPLLGNIAAGQPIEAIENKETIAVPQSRLPLPYSNCFALRVQGDSMRDENINDRDIVLIKEQRTAENGQKVVALVNHSETTLKTFYKEHGHIRLQPENKTMAPIIIPRGSNIAIQGVVVDVIKRTGEGSNLISAPDFRASAIENPPRPLRSLELWRNRVFHGDVMNLLAMLPNESVDMIFGDPDYNVGIKYGGMSYTKSFSEYIEWYIQLAKESIRVLKHDGNLFMLNYPKQNAHLRVKYLDEHYQHISEYVWVYNTNVGHSPSRFTTAHRSILHIRKSKDNCFFKNAVALPYKNPTDKRIQNNLANGSTGRMPYSWFEFNLVKNVSKEKTEHACQIPQKLTELMIKATTKPGDVVFPLFGGSGAEIEVAQRLNRDFLTAELNPRYCEIIEDRLKKGYIAGQYRLGPRGRRKSIV